MTKLLPSLTRHLEMLDNSSALLLAIAEMLCSAARLS